jgi:hypothetical protein
MVQDTCGSNVNVRRREGVEIMVLKMLRREESQNFQ